MKESWGGGIHKLPNSGQRAPSAGERGCDRRSLGRGKAGGGKCGAFASYLTMVDMLHLLRGEAAGAGILDTGGGVGGGVGGRQGEDKHWSLSPCK